LSADERQRGNETALAFVIRNPKSFIRVQRTLG